MKYWVGVVSADHVAEGIKQGIVQVNHGKKWALAKMAKGDGLIYYSSKQVMTDKTPLQKFTALGTITDKEPYQVSASKNFEPWRRNVAYEKIKPLPIHPILGELSFIKNKTHWGVAFRFGFLEIPQKDFEFLASLLLQLS